MRLSDMLRSSAAFNARPSMSHDIFMKLYIYRQCFIVEAMPIFAERVSDDTFSTR